MVVGPDGIMNSAVDISVSAWLAPITAPRKHDKLTHVQHRELGRLARQVVDIGVRKARNVLVIIKSLLLG